ncbi:hypothetical protein AAHZ94_15350 [Streptomyces sp. HSW2009]
MDSLTARISHPLSSELAPFWWADSPWIKKWGAKWREREGVL